MEFVWKESDDTRLAGAAPSIGSVEDGERALVQWNWRNGLRESGLPWLRRKTTREVFTINKALVFAN